MYVHTNKSNGISFLVDCEKMTKQPCTQGLVVEIRVGDWVEINFKEYFKFFL